VKYYFAAAYCFLAGAFNLYLGLDVGSSFIPDWVSLVLGGMCLTCAAVNLISAWGDK
jgi:hypothetical protein